VAAGPLGRYSILFRKGEGELSLSSCNAIHCSDQAAEKTGLFLEELQQWYERDSVPFDSDSSLPFIGGWFVFLAYELAGEIEPVLDLPDAPGSLPVALAVRCDAAIVIRHGNNESASLVAESAEVLNQMHDELEQVRPGRESPLPGLKSFTADKEAPFIESVQRIKKYLTEGDVFQVNISRAWHAEFESSFPVADLYRALREGNPSPFAGMMNWNGLSLLSSSPERLVEIRGNTVQTRPIAGTYPRGENIETDRMLSSDMLQHPKEQAEHIMLIDLERNDLGRVCETGSVEVDELMVLESYAHVHHIVSNIQGKLRDGITPVDVIRAVFPGGTITGCPKVRCMEIIAELEGKGRGFYTGSMGYISRDGQTDLNILIRSMLTDGQRVSLRTGAGIVADSVAEKELAETGTKAKGMLMALGVDYA
jgi:anthranilate synthase component 1